MTEPLNLKAIEARLEPPFNYDANDVRALIHAVRETRTTLTAFVTCDAIVNYDSSLCWGCGGARHTRYETSDLDAHAADCTLVQARTVLEGVRDD